jgi:hypothetical protein
MGTTFLVWEIVTSYLFDFSTSGNTWSNLLILNRALYFDSLSSWLLPTILPLSVRMILLAGGFLITFFVARKTFAVFFKEPKQKTLFLFWFVYVIGLFCFWGAPDFHEVDRYLAVILPFFMLTFFNLVSKLSQATVVSRWFFKMITIAWLIYPVSRTLYHLYNG